MDIHQKSLSEISLGRKDFKLTIGELNNNIPYSVQELSKIRSQHGLGKIKISSWR